MYNKCVISKRSKQIAKTSMAREATNNGNQRRNNHEKDYRSSSNRRRCSSTPCQKTRTSRSRITEQSKKAEDKDMKKIAVAVAVLTVVLVGMKKRHAQADRV